jgi:phage antirepressor YoqD-like protein
MNELTAIKTMTSREVATLTGKQHKHVIRDIRIMLEQMYSKKDGPNLDHLEIQGVFIEHDERGYTAQISLDKDHTLTLLTGYDANARMRVIKRWQELEAKAINPALPDFTNPAEAARAWASEYEGKARALAQLEEAQPAIEFHERVGDADSLHSIDETAKVLRAKPMTFRRYLKDTLQLFRLDGLPKQPFLDRGYVRTVETILPHTGKPYPQTFFTGKGLQWIQRRVDHSLMGIEI